MNKNAFSQIGYDSKIPFLFENIAGRQIPGEKSIIKEVPKIWTHGPDKKSRINESEMIWGHYKWRIIFGDDFKLLSQTFLIFNSVSPYIAHQEGYEATEGEKKNMAQKHLALGVLNQGGRWRCE